MQWYVLNVIIDNYFTSNHLKGLIWTILFFKKFSKCVFESVISEFCCSFVKIINNSETLLSVFKKKNMVFVTLNYEYGLSQLSIKVYRRSIII